MRRIYVYTGDGAGKTTGAFGRCMRALGQGQTVLVGYFMKAVKTGEYKLQYKIDGLTAYLLGDKGWVSQTDPSEKDKDLVRSGLDFIIEEGIRKKPNNIILDEINIAAGFRMIDPQHVISKIEELPLNTNVFLTGRYAPKEFIDIATHVVQIDNKKYPANMTSDEGMEY